MRKVLILFLCIYSSFVYSITATEAWNSCNTFLQSQSSSLDKVCDDWPSQSYVRYADRPLGSNSSYTLGTFWSYDTGCGPRPASEGGGQYPVDNQTGLCPNAPPPLSTLDVLPDGCVTNSDGSVTCPLSIDNSQFDIKIQPPTLTEDKSCIGISRSGSSGPPLKTVCPGTNNQSQCGYINGKYVCLVPSGTTSNPSDPGWNTKGNCYSLSDGSINCIDGKAGVNTNTSTNTTDNQDGTSTEITITTSNVIDYGDVTITKTIDNSTGKVIASKVDGSSSTDPGKTDNDAVVRAVGEVNDTLTDAFKVPSGSSSVSTDNYTPGTQTFSTVLESFNTRLTNSQLGLATTSIFTINIAPGACPVWSTSSISSGIFTFPSIVIDAQCSTVMTSIWPVISSVLFAVASFFALRIALL